MSFIYVYVKHLQNDETFIELSSVTIKCLHIICMICNVILYIWPNAGK